VIQIHHSLKEEGKAMTAGFLHRNERGIALVVVLLVVLAVAAIAAGAALLGSNTSLINKYHDRQSVLETVADAGLEEARSAVNGNKTLYPDTGYNTLESGVAVYNAAGAVIPNIKRWTYVGPIGITSGQYGVFGSAVTVVKDAQGNTVIRRAEIAQESFAKFAYFTNVEGAIVFGAGDQLFGPVHSNDVINVGSGTPKPTFWGAVTTAKTISNKTNGTFKQGYTENGPNIPFPATADLNKLKAQATLGNMNITSTLSGTIGQATTRIEFVAIDINSDTDSSDDNEGFIKVYKVASATNAWWLVADTTKYFTTNTDTSGVRNSPNCGHVFTGAGTYHAGFVTFANHPKTWNAGNDSKTNAATYTGAGVSQRRCYLGGSDILNGPAAPFTPNDGRGSWQPWPGAVDPLVAAKVGSTYAAYLWPISRAFNPNYKGVIFVDGKVVVSGKLRGQVTLAATDNIIIADDITYVTNPGSTTPCASSSRDMLGLFSGTDVIVADNLLNDPIPPVNGGAWTSWDDTPDEFIHGVVLALSNWTVENYNTGPTNAEPCGTTVWGRGCLYLTGGIIQYQRGAVGLVDGHGYLKRYSYDACAATNPPPYFPTTGHFARAHFYEVEPTGFNIASYWALLK
jgi:Tfp pilus assembly protein PilX